MTETSCACAEETSGGSVLFVSTLLVKTERKHNKPNLKVSTLNKTTDIAMFVILIVCVCLCVYRVGNILVQILVLKCKTREQAAATNGEKKINKYIHLTVS